MASGRNFCCSVLDLNKKSFLTEQTAVKFGFNTKNGCVKAWRSSNVSKKLIKSLIKPNSLNFLHVTSLSADAPACWLEKNVDNADRKKSFLKPTEPYQKLLVTKAHTSKLNNPFSNLTSLLCSVPASYCENFLTERTEVAKRFHIQDKKNAHNLSRPQSSPVALKKAPNNAPKIIFKTVPKNAPKSISISAHNHAFATASAALNKAPNYASKTAFKTDLKNAPKSASKSAHNHATVSATAPKTAFKTDLKNAPKSASKSAHNHATVSATAPKKALRVALVTPRSVVKSNLSGTFENPKARTKRAYQKAKCKLIPGGQIITPNKLVFRHASLIVVQRLRVSQDVETNPGPEELSGTNRGQQTNNSPILVTTYNVRGLNDEAKLRHLLNYFYTRNRGKDMDFIACLQETFIEGPGKLPYLWRGNHFITPGNGNSLGCITLLSPHINVVSGVTLANRGHVLACQKSGEKGISFIVANIYAPNPNTNEKIEFFNEVFDKILEFEERYECETHVIAGDFNLTLEAHEMKNRLFSNQEKRVGNALKLLIKDSGLKDIWEDNRAFTWRRANSDCFSTIDRIIYSNSKIKCENVTDNWALSFSDHAAIEANFSYIGRAARIRSKIPRIDPTIVRSPELAQQLTEGVNEMMREVPVHWDPHKKLEFLKVSIRTVAERLQADRNRKERTEEQEINEELNLSINVLGNEELAGEKRNRLIEYVEELRARKSNLIEEKGARLAEKLGSKWYNEGEKSTRYFLRLLNRQMPDDFKEIENADGIKITTQEGIKEEVVNFYKKLYEDFERIDTVDDASFFNELNPVSDSEREKVVRQITTEELRTTLHSCQDSAPGPDGIPYSVIGHLWPIFGELLCNAWNHSLVTSTLAPSHKTSYLKLIPKAGKDLCKLTNWRPITLSNCDHKLITKTYSKRLCESVGPQIGGCQTAYIKSRLINDNIRAMLSTVDITNIEKQAGILLSLDAKKAFDSVDHKYIERCLERFGCGDFVPIFRVLYSDLATDIIINGQVVKGYNIKRGVKQGDALSCILFIMCMEPLIRNLEANPNIAPIFSNKLNKTLPKTYAYADDVNVTIKDSEASVREVFKEYERLSRNSGLELNADKTEMMLLGQDFNERQVKIKYLGKSYKIKAESKIKINGILFQTDLRRMADDNVDLVIKRIDRHCKAWSRRSLSTLGKVLIMKTFGISQAIYLFQSIVLNKDHFKKLNGIIYKFIWNRHYLAAKAPERIKREIMNKPIKYGGFGMLDIIALDESIKIKALGRIQITSHPFMLLIKNCLDLDRFFSPKDCTGLDGVIRKGIELLEADRDSLWVDSKLDSHRGLLKAIGDTNIKDVINEQGRNSIPFYLLWRSGARKVKDLRPEKVRELSRYIRNDKMIKIINAINTRSHSADPNIMYSYFVNGQIKLISAIKSKDIRVARTNQKPLNNFKIGMQLGNEESLSWGLRLAKINSTRHKNLMLRVAHGEIYTKEKLHRFGLIDSPLCPRCSDIETLQHKFIDCTYVNRIWAQILQCQRSITTSDPLAEQRDKAIMGGYRTSNTTVLTINAEILHRILTLKDDASYLVHPKVFVKNSISYLIRKEKANEIKNGLRSILDSLER